MRWSLSASRATFAPQPRDGSSPADVNSARSDAAIAQLLAVAEDLGGDLEEQTEKLLADLADPDRANHLTASAL